MTAFRPLTNPVDFSAGFCLMQGEELAVASGAVFRLVVRERRQISRHQFAMRGKLRTKEVVIAKS